LPDCIRELRRKRPPRKPKPSEHHLGMEDFDAPLLNHQGPQITPQRGKRLYPDDFDEPDARVLRPDKDDTFYE